MEINDIQNACVLEIFNEKYDVLNFREEIDRFDSEKNEIVGEHLAFELHKQKDSALHSTHLLKIYYNHNEKVISLEDVKVVG